ncbi:LuxR C-terminal-related transcriptional regulator [Actinomadura sp. 1N219]|uniref:LuxR C-terminal-related transcriptional regulator n=1 Tax=Actinomadura sp. 1N219 TaxID=3375152 RepID=UPI0037BD6F0B
MAGTRVALRSSDRLLREAVADSLSTLPDVIVTGATDRFSDLLTLCGLRRTDVVLVDIGLRFGEEETAGVLALRSLSSELAIVLTYERLSAEATLAAAHAGATRLVPHSRGLHALVEAVLEGPAPVDRHPGPAVLTDRDRQVLSLISTGFSVREMASLIGVSEATVQNHKRRIFAKLDVHSQTHVVARAARMGLLQTPPYTGPAPGRPGRSLVVVVIGTGCDVRHSVVLTLIRHAVPVLVLGPDIPSEEDELIRLRNGAIAVLVDGTAADWRATRLLGTRTVVVISPYEHATIAGELLRGADAVVGAHDVSEQLTHVIALAAQSYATSEAARATPARSHVIRSDITPRELDILRSIALGHSVRQTAAALGITSKTVENTQARLFRKLSVRNRAEALAVAYSLGLVMEE